MIRVIHKGESELRRMKFPVGEVKLEMDEIDIYSSDSVIIEWFYKSDEELFQVIALVDYLRSVHEDRKIALKMPYIPYARMDRVKTEAFTLKTFANLINQCNFSKVWVEDAHSNVSLALLNQVQNSAWTEDSRLINKITDKCIVIYPDVTSEKRYSDIIAKETRAKGSITCMKSRNFETGQIDSLIPVTSLDLSKDYSDYRFIMVDDLCSYGGTFNYAIEEIRKVIPTAQQFELIVGHLEKGYLDGKLVKNPYFTALWTKKTLGWQFELTEEEKASLFEGKIHMFGY